jgi:outer membrane protein assembly factor BamB
LWGRFSCRFAKTAQRTERPGHEAGRRPAALLPAALLLIAVLLAACSGSASRPAPGGAPSSSSGGPSTVTTPDAHGTTTTGPAGSQAAYPDPNTWPTYQGNAQRLGATGAPPITPPLTPAWTAGLDGAAVYAQPVVAGGRVVVATEADDLYALDAATGSVAWKVNLGTPLRRVSALTGCGDIDPLGITSTPVIDPAAGVVYAVGEVSSAGALPVRHELAAVDLGSGRILATRDVDPPLPPGEDRAHLLQRAALALGNGRVYVGYGGLFGDCGRYHGWVVATPTVSSGGAPAGPGNGAVVGAFDVTPRGTGGAIWGGGSGPSIGSDGAVYVTTGNPNSADPAPWAEAAVKLAPALGPTPLAHFVDRAATGDLDLSSGGPVLLPGGRLFAVGKADVGYLLRQSDLSLISPIKGTVCGSDPDGGDAYDAASDTLFVPCRDGGIQEIDLASATIGWRSGSANSTPILVGGELWALSYPGGRLQEIDPGRGRVLYSTSVGRSVPTFAAPSAAAGRLLVPTAAGVVAFRSR